MNVPSDRAGRFTLQEGRYEAFVPKALPPDPPLEHDGEMLLLMSEADRAMARLDGVTMVLPDPNVYVEMYLVREALLSSQIEGTQASLEDVLQFNAGVRTRDDTGERREVANYVKATHQALAALATGGLSVEVIKDAHRQLLAGTRGANMTPGEFRRVQNYVGPPGRPILEATYVPPPPDLVPAAMDELAAFIEQDDKLPPLVKAALIHAQFETIHPFRDGNGRIGRLLVALFLCRRRALLRPLLCLSYFLKKERDEYYDRLMRVRSEGDWEGWVKFFLRAAAETSAESAQTAGRMVRLKERLHRRLVEKRILSVHAVGLLDLLFHEPVVGVPDVVRRFGVSRPTATDLVHRFVDAGILVERTGKKRRQRFTFREYVTILKRGTEVRPVRTGRAPRSRLAGLPAPGL